jgi:putative ABC transport system permease protein
MFTNYLKIAWRNATRHKAYSAINILGLAIGIAACLLILQYVSFELSYENFQVNKDRIYRVQQDRYDKGKLSTQWAAGAYAGWEFFQSSYTRNRGLCESLLRRKGYCASKQPAPEN